MPASPQAVIIDPNGQVVLVTITESGGGTPVAYTDATGTTVRSNPKTINTRTAFYLATPATYTVSAKVDGAEVANGANSTVTADLTGGGVFTLTVTAPAALTAVTARAATSRQIPTFDVGNACVTRTLINGAVTPVIDLQASNIGARDPEIFQDTDGTFYVTYSRVPNQSAGQFGNGTDWTVGYATGPSLTQLTDQGALFATATILTGQGTPSGAAGVTILNAGTYHHFFSAADDWRSVHKGQVYHLTAPAAVGPWTLADVALPFSTGHAPLDNSAPVFYAGQWRMLYLDYAGDGTGTRSMKIASATSLSGPWTVTTLSNFGGESLVFDAPTLFTINGRLYFFQTGDDFSVWAYDLSDLSVAKSFGPVLIATGSAERGDLSFGSTGLLITADGECLVAYMANAVGSLYPKVFPARFGAQRLFNVPGRAGLFHTGTLTAGAPSVTVSLGSWQNPSSADDVPPCTYAMTGMFRFTETSTFTAGELVRVDGGFNTYSNEAYPPALNVPCVAAGGPIPMRFDSTGPYVRLVATSATSISYAFTPTGAWYLPL